MIVKLFPLLRLAAFLMFLAPAVSSAAPDCMMTAPKPTLVQMHEASKSAHDRGFLWRISKDGRNSWLYGTIHVARFEWMFPGPQVMAALQASDAIALEIDAMDKQVIRKATQLVSRLPSIELPPALSARMRIYAESFCISYDNISSLPPELQLATLMMQMGRLDGYFPEFAVDSMLSHLGHQQNKRVVSLETPEYQLQQLLLNSPDETITMIKEDLDILDRIGGRGYIARVAKVWSESDVKSMENFETWCQCMETALQRKSMSRLLEERNFAMSAGLDRLHMQGLRVFGAVGSLHMFGPQGLPKLMEKLGYRVERIELAHH